MGTFSIWHWLVLGLLVMVLFGRGKVSDFMGDFAKGIKNFREGLKDSEEEERAKQAKSISSTGGEAMKTAADVAKDPAGH